MFIDKCNFLPLPWAYPLVVTQEFFPPPLEMGFLVECIQELSIQLLSLNFSSTPLLDFSSVIQQGGSSLKEVCPLWLIGKASWFLQELMLSSITWHWPWSSSLWVSYSNKHILLLLSDRTTSRQKKISKQCGEPHWYLMLLVHGLLDTARLNRLQGEVRIPWEAVASGLSSETFWSPFNTVCLGRSEFPKSHLICWHWGAL